MVKGRDTRSYRYEGSLGSIIAWAGGPIYGANSYEETDVNYVMNGGIEGFLYSYLQKEAKENV